MKTDLITKFLLGALTIALLLNAPKIWISNANASPVSTITAYQIPNLIHFTMDQQAPDGIVTGASFYANKLEVRAVWEDHAPGSHDSLHPSYINVGGKTYPVRQPVAEIEAAMAH